MPQAVPAIARMLQESIVLLALLVMGSGLFLCVFPSTA